MNYTVIAKKEKEIRLRYLNDMEMFKIDEVNETLDTFVKSVRRYLEGEKLVDVSTSLWNLNYLKEHLNDIEKIRTEIKELEGGDTF